MSYGINVCHYDIRVCYCGMRVCHYGINVCHYGINVCHYLNMHVGHSLSIVHHAELERTRYNIMLNESSYVKKHFKIMYNNNVEIQKR